MFILFKFYLFYEIDTKLSVDHFYFSSYPFRKPEWEKNDVAQKKMKKSHIGNMPQSYSQF